MSTTHDVDNWPSIGEYEESIGIANDAGNPERDSGENLVRLPSHSVTHRGVADVVAAMNDLKAIRTFIANELIDGTDYGKIPGTGDKKNFLLPGAQKVCMFFNVRPEYNVERNEIGNGHVEFIVKTQLISRVSGLPVGAGVGSCTTMEGKYRYRNSKPDDTGLPVPKEYWKDRNPELLGGKEFTIVKVDGQWHIARKSDEKVENENIYDIRNTVLKMGKKRSLVDASIGLGCLSELFTQDLEDIFDINPNSSLAAGADHSTVKSSHHSGGLVLEADTDARPEPVASPAPNSTPATMAIAAAVITLVAVTEKKNKKTGIIGPATWHNNGVLYAMYNDAAGQTWTFCGKDDVNTADAACGTGTKLRVEYEQDKYGRKVTKVERA